jgi:glutathione S-transferase
MTDKIIFYYNPMSRGRIVHWMLEEVGADYEVKFHDWQEAEHKSPEYFKINPIGKIPTIIHKGVVITETPAICLLTKQLEPRPIFQNYVKLCSDRPAFKRFTDQAGPMES